MRHDASTAMHDNHVRGDGNNTKREDSLDCTCDASTTKAHISYAVSARGVDRTGFEPVTKEL